MTACSNGPGCRRSVDAIGNASSMIEQLTEGKQLISAESAPACVYGTSGCPQRRCIRRPQTFPTERKCLDGQRSNVGTASNRLKQVRKNRRSALPSCAKTVLVRR